MSIVIAIATYQRPHLLVELLDSIAVAKGTELARISVTDNDPAGSAREVCMRYSSMSITYVVEPAPGIAAARNCGLRTIQPTDEFIVFVDDDERVESNWLLELLDAQRRFSADVVSGPVISVFSERTPRWIVSNGFIQRARFSTGEAVRSPATNNTLVRIDSIRRMEHPVFSEAYSMTGGSDTEFFRRLRLTGAKMIWCDEALVYEDVPEGRANLKWILKRGVREGNVSGRLRLFDVTRVRLFSEGMARVAYGGVRCVGMLLILRGLDRKGIAYITRGIGWIGASLNRYVIEYSRKPKNRTRRST